MIFIEYFKGFKIILYIYFTRWQININNCGVHFFLIYWLNFTSVHNAFYTFQS